MSGPNSDRQVFAAWLARPPSSHHTDTTIHTHHHQSSRRASFFPLALSLHPSSITPTRYHQAPFGAYRVSLVIVRHPSPSARFPPRQRQPSVAERTDNFHRERRTLDYPLPSLSVGRRLAAFGHSAAMIPRSEGGLLMSPSTSQDALYSTSRTCACSLPSSHLRLLQLLPNIAATYHGPPHFLAPTHNPHR